MTRQERYPDTDTFHFYNANPRGKYTSDCSVRALCTVLDRDYSQVMLELTDLAIKTGYHTTDIKLMGKYLELNGFRKYPQPKHDNGTKYRGTEFCREVQNNAGAYGTRIFAKLGSHHVVAIMWGEVWDIANSTFRTVGNYWMK